MNSTEADANHPFAGETYGLVSNCYERLKADGQISVEEADTMIEWGYQTLFDGYPNCLTVDHAALRLGEINMARGRPVSACVYFNWYLDHAHAATGQFADINRVLALMEGGCQ